MTPASPSLASDSSAPAWVHRALKLFAPAVGVLGMVALVLFYRANPTLTPIRSDGYGYHLYLTALFVQHDLSMRTEAAEWGPDMPYELGLTLDESTGRYLNRFPPGQAILMMPAFLVAHASAPLVGARRDGFSRPYQVAAALNGLLALVIGLTLLRKSLESLYPPQVVLATLAVVTFGTNLFHYGTADAIFSHVYSFALFAALLLLVPTWYREPTVRRSLLLGLVAGFIMLVRNPNAVALLFVPLYGVINSETQRQRLAFFRTHWRSVACVVLAAAGVLSILVAYWHSATGRWLVFSYRGQGFEFDRPLVLSVLFSVRKGLFFWTPVWLFAVVGFVRDRERLQNLLLPVLLFTIVHLYLVSTWWHWPYGSSFGHRAFTEASAFFAPGIAGFLASLKHSSSRRLAGAVLALLVAFEVFLMTRYWQGRIPGDRTTWAQYRDIFTLP
ncbi:hypothetical protein JY651_16640 [Pyxidicoccus parkwayensis]|uniref:Glycosyltransferase RgtA/B/C/D-like domain-containing protein n=1 Tax=Pyxidicoccus parkwayensis TaxID=2813578 RepID=A0ABX7P7G9_9BACT|nr:hypothetical protein [Pyxidicoccus parkwaysis]QSQ26454.1 hypothetical protein JY651_16640 [Pyxidicoccus parkwaysis]